ncbi:MAG TPA: TIGR03435 family protein [Bryobacteraceae bacterium]|jgi:uncharacterized protein (TIGR03435 family)
MNIFRPMIVACLASQFVCAQPQSATARFDVISIKKGDGVTMSANPPIKGGRIKFTDVTLVDILSVAYPVDVLHMFGGPAWVSSEKYDVEAITDDVAVSTGRYHQMLRTMLAERFMLALHQETRQEPIYVLEADSKGVKLKPTPPGGCVVLPVGAAPPPKTAICNDFSGSRTHLEGTGLTMAKFADILSYIVGRRVSDNTGLTARFNIRFDYTPGNAVAVDQVGASDSPPSIFAVLGQLGLRLRSEMGPVPVLFIDHVEQPSGN